MTRQSQHFQFYLMSRPCQCRQAAVLARIRTQKPSQVPSAVLDGAGGVGPNLRFAPYVFLFDRWWNRDLGLTHQENFGLFKLRCPAGPIDVAA